MNNDIYGIPQPAFKNSFIVEYICDEKVKCDALKSSTTNIEYDLVKNTLNFSVDLNLYNGDVERELLTWSKGLQKSILILHLDKMHEIGHKMQCFIHKIMSCRVEYDYAGERTVRAHVECGVHAFLPD